MNAVMRMARMEALMFIASLAACTAAAAEPVRTDARTASSAAGAAFGRLFFSPAERQRLSSPPSSPAPAAASEEALTEPPPIHVDGVVRSSSGTTIVWIDGRPVRSTETPPAGAADTARISAADGRSVVLRVGESYRPATGQRDSALPSVKVHPPAPDR